MPQAFSHGTGTYALPGGSNTYVKNHQATGNLVISYSRNPKDFPLNRYVQIREVKKDSGFYLQITAEEAGRVVGGNLSEFVWPDGADRPRRNAGHEQFRFVDYRTERFDFDFTLGYKAQNQADWDVRETGAATKSQQAMTARTRAVQSTLADETNWDASHIVAVDAIPGCQDSWELSTTQRGDIKKSLNYGTQVIQKETLSVVKKKDLQLVMNPVTAARIGESAEIRDYIKGSEDAWKQVIGQEGLYSEYGMPNALYGYEIVVEDAVMVTSPRGAATVVRSWVAPDGIAYLLARPGGLVSSGGGPSWSTIMLLMFEEMTVETFDDDKNRRTEGDVVEDYAPAMTAPVSGFKFNACIE
jgi:hypothetical protein